MTTTSVPTADRELRDQLVSQRMDAVNQLAAGVAHEFNNVLQIVRGYVAVVQTALPPGTQSHEDLDHAIEATDRAADLATRLLRFARAEDTPGATADVADAIESMRLLLRPVIGENIRLRVDAEDGLPAASVGDASLRQALLNLCVNARDAMPEGGTLTLQARRCDTATGPFDIGECFDGPGVCVSVNDTGEGIDPACRERLFEPFFTTKAPGEGTGLGLPMVATCVRSAGGALRIESGLDRGARFDLYLPAACDTADVPSPEQEVIAR